MFDLSKIENNKKIALLLRHSEREAIPKGELGDDVNITPYGIKLANNFGIQLQKFNVNKIFTSPVKRCIQTANQIAFGYQKKIEITETQILGSPSAYINDIEKATEHFLKSSVFENYMALCNGKKLSGFCTLNEGSEILDNFINQNKRDDSLTLFISHDIIILYYIYYKTKTIYTRENWLDFLDGTII